MPTITEVCLENSFKVAHRDYGIDYKTYMKHRPDLVASNKCNDEFLEQCEEAMRVQEIRNNEKQHRQKQQRQEEKATATMLKALVEQMTKRSKFFTND